MASSHGHGGSHIYLTCSGERAREYAISWDENTIPVLCCDLNVNSVIPLWIFLLSIYVA